MTFTLDSAVLEIVGPALTVADSARDQEHWHWNSESKDETISVTLVWIYY